MISSVLRSQIISVLFICTTFSGCNSPKKDSTVSPPANTGGGGSSTSNLVSLSTLSVPTYNHNSFSVTVDFAGDANSNASVVVFYCSKSDNASCDPVTDGVSHTLTRSGGQFTGTISGLSSPFDADDELKIRAVASDTDNVGTVTLDGSNFKLLLRSQTLSILEENDDGEIWMGFNPGSQIVFNGENNSSDVYAGIWDGIPVLTFLRFKLVKAIPAGSTITNAQLSLYGNGDFYWNNSTHLIITADDSANANQLTSAADRIGGENGRNAVPVTVDWYGAAGANLNWNTSGLNTSSNISTIIQSIVDRNNGIAANSYIQLWLYTDAPATSGSGAEVGIADFGHANHATSFTVDWSN